MWRGTLVFASFEKVFTSVVSRQKTHHFFTHNGLLLGVEPTRTQSCLHASLANRLHVEQRTPIGRKLCDHELQLDWRYGAAYFEQQLIVDVASNWGNWQYLSVALIPEAERFNLDKQTQTYDPNGELLSAGMASKRKSTADAADWPLS